MGKVVRRIVAVVTVTAVTAFGVYALVDILPVASPNPATASSAGSLSAPSSAPARTSSSSAAPVLLTCPVTGCRFSTCHGATGAPPPSRSQANNGSQSGAGSGSVQGSGQAAATGSGQKTLTAGATYAASLLGAQLVPPVSTTATATVTFTRASSGTVLRYVLRVRGIRNPTVARLHEGAAGANGPALATLFAGPAKSGIFTGTLASGTLRATSLGGPLAGKKLADLLSLIKAGRVYVLLGTTQHLAGEVRGEIKVSAA